MRYDSSVWRGVIALALVAGCARKGGAGDADAGTPIGAGDRVSLVGTVAVEPPFDLAGRSLIGVVGSSAVTFDLAGVERSHVGLRGGPSLRIQALAADPQGRALLAVAFTENVWIEDHAMPFAGFDVYRIERNDAQALPGAFAGVVSE